MRRVLRSLWDEPRATDPPARVWRDWVVVALLVSTAIIEAAARDDISWRPGLVVIPGLLVFTVLFRRRFPLVMVAVAFGTFIVVDSILLLTIGSTVTIYAAGFVLLLPYALFRWGSGREAAIGLAVMLVAMLFSQLAEGTGVGDTIGGAIVLLLPAQLGAVVRYQKAAQRREVEQVKLREREQLARELHDTVAHHVSAIAIQAQAGQAIAASEPGAAIDALAIIEEEASRTLAEMRSMVGALRSGEEAQLAPQPGVADIERLAQVPGDGPTIVVDVSGSVGGLRSSVDSAVYRLAQESVTNAIRHARRASRISVFVAADDDNIRLTVSDDGDPCSGVDAASAPGYGLLGMMERTKLLGGSLHAGPNPGRGWTVSAVLPLQGPTR